MIYKYIYIYIYIYIYELFRGIAFKLRTIHPTICIIGNIEKENKY